MSRLIGLTGGIGSGKSTAAGMLAALGAGVVDSYEISRELTAAGGAALPALREAFGGAIVPPGGALDRAAMRALAFSDSGARARLEGILHPLISPAPPGEGLWPGDDPVYVAPGAPLELRWRGLRPGLPARAAAGGLGGRADAARRAPPPRDHRGGVGGGVPLGVSARDARGLEGVPSADGLIAVDAR